ncbi:MAG: pilus assembly protein TadG-related protein [Pseudomonadota bacterium]
MSDMKKTLIKRSGLSRIIDRAMGFRKNERGTMIAFSLSIFVMMLWSGGMAIDFMRYEHDRSRVQYTLDRAALAAASLKQPLDCEVVARDYFEKVGLPNTSVRVEGNCSALSKTVQVSADTEVKSFFMNMLGIKSMSAGASSTAEETAQDVEISLVLDVSGSMGWDDATGTQTKLEALQTAANEFLDALLIPDNADRISINIIPYNMQVNAGEDVLDLLNVTDEHAYSNCVDFEEADFSTVEISADVAGGGGGANLGDLSITDGTGGVMGTAADLQRTGHFDPYYTTINHPGVTTDDNVSRAFVCPTTEASEITLMSQDLGSLKGVVNGLTAGGNTSIDIGVKWGSYFLNPNSNVLLGAIPEGSTALTRHGPDEFDENGVFGPPKSSIPDAFAARPYAYNRDNTIKIMVVMTDGVNTTQYQLEDDYASGESTLYINDTVPGNSSTTWLSHYKQRPGGNNDYFMSRGNYHEDYFSGTKRHGSNPDPMTWPEVWNMMGVKYFAYYYNYVRDWNASEYYNTRDDVLDYVYAGAKNTRLNNACTEAKDAGVLVFAIGFAVSDASATVMQNCSTSASHFYRVDDGYELSDAFGGIANTIQRLKLTN